MPLFYQEIDAMSSRGLVSNNDIQDIGALVQNLGLGSGDTVFLLGNPLPDIAIERDIAALRERGVDVRY